MATTNSLAAALKTARKARGLSQEAFSDVSSRTYLSTLERGLKSPTLSKLSALCEVMEIHPLTLLTLAYAGDKDSNITRLQAQVQSEIALLLKKGGAGKVEATNLASLLNNSDAWFNLGNGVYSPRCLAWAAPNGQAQFIQLTKEGGDWKEVSAADACITAP